MKIKENKKNILPYIKDKDTIIFLLNKQQAQEYLILFTTYLSLSIDLTYFKIESFHLPENIIALSFTSFGYEFAKIEDGKDSRQFS